MDFKDENARLLFLKYALPCGFTLVKRGVVSKKILTDAIESLATGKVNGRPEKLFKTALSTCKSVAKAQGKTTVDKASIRKYFLLEHDAVVNMRYFMFKDFNTLKCRTYSGRVVKMKGNIALVKTLIGTNKYRYDFCKELKKGDCVVVHRNFVVEIISEAKFRQLWKLKERYFNSKKSIVIS
ncbi:MAG: HypC/HybG/HupF family hydrogenase formation chaperone [Candidatus Aenigmatarchaeota archaeon]